MIEVARVSDLVPALVDAEALEDELVVLHAWMIASTLEGQSSEKISGAQRDRLREAAVALRGGLRRTFDEHFAAYEAIEEKVMTFGRAHNSSFEGHAAVFLSLCGVEADDVPEGFVLSYGTIPGRR